MDLSCFDQKSCMSKQKTNKSQNASHYIEEKDLRGFKFFRNLFPLLEKYHSVKDHHNRDLHFDQYLCLFLLYFFNPALTSLRAIQQATTLKKVQDKLGVKQTSLGSLSEASNVFDAQLVAPLLKQLASQALCFEKDPKLKQLQQALVAVDGTLLRALPKMLWALWIDDHNRAAKLHLEFDIEKSIPTGAVITHGNANEKHVFKDSFLGPNKLYVLDAGYCEYKLLYSIKSHKSSFVARLRDNAVWETIEQRPLTESDRQAGVTKDLIVYLGSDTKKKDYPCPVRIVEVFHKGDESIGRKSRVSSKKTFRTTDTDYYLLLVTDRIDLPAEVIALIYRYRWFIELFFRWFKCILGCKHLLAQSQNGLTIQVYCALIASMLITLWTGCKPTKRTFEMLQLYFMGWADLDELEAHIEKLKQRNQNNA